MAQSKHSEIPETFTVSLQSVRKSGRVLYALSQFYLPFYSCDLRVLLFDHFDVFGCISAGVYEIDELIEAGVPAGDAFRKLSILEAYLAGQVECDEYIRARFDDARNYYSFEGGLLRGNTAYTLDDLVAITEIRSFDFRIMHRALLQLTGQKFDRHVFSWFRWFEMLMELEDDLLSAAEDMERGTYNILCFATRLSPDSATAFIEDFRRRIERGMHECWQELSEPQRIASASVHATYRKIVPRPDISTSFQGIADRRRA